MCVAKPHIINADNDAKNLIGVIFSNFLSYYVL